MPFMNFKIVNAKNIWMEFKKLLKYGISMWHIYVAYLCGISMWQIWHILIIGCPTEK